MIVIALLIIILIISFINFLFLASRFKWWSALKTLLSIKGQKISLSAYEEFVSQLAISLQWLSKNKTGALIIVIDKNNLHKYIQLGCTVNARFTPEFLINIFSNKNSAFHDGGVIIRGLDIISVSSYFPITTNNLNASYGARHRAGIGITEQTDAIAAVVSETTGKLTIARKGTLEEISTTDLNTLSASLSEIFNFYIQ